MSGCKDLTGGTAGGVDQNVYERVKYGGPDLWKILIVHSLSSGKVAATPILKSVPSQFSPFIL